MGLCHGRGMEWWSSGERTVTAIIEKYFERGPQQKASGLSRPLVWQRLLRKCRCPRRPRCHRRPLDERRWVSFVSRRQVHAASRESQHCKTLAAARNGPKPSLVELTLPSLGNNCVRKPTPVTRRAELRGGSRVRSCWCSLVSHPRRRRARRGPPHRLRQQRIHSRPGRPYIGRERLA